MDTRKWRAHPLVHAVALVAISTTAGFAVAATQSGKLREALQLAAVTLLYGALLGGVVKLLLDDFNRIREKRVEYAAFITAMLADLKAVYDRVERVRILIPAHRSALTYGNEMRDLIDAGVQLKNVTRALDRTSGMRDQAVCDLRLAVKAMEDYLAGLTAEFGLRYKPIADKQKLYEARVKTAIEASSVGRGSPPPFEVANEAWAEITKLRKMEGFIGSWSDADSAHFCMPSEYPSEYQESFIDPLDLGCWILRSELQAALTGRATLAFPSNHQETRDRLGRTHDAEGTPSPVASTALVP